MAEYLRNRVDYAEGHQLTDLVKDRIVRVMYSCTPEQEEALNRPVLQQDLYGLGAFYVADIQAENMIETTNHDLLSEESDPLVNLRKWLEEKKFPDPDAITELGEPIIREAQRSITTASYRDLKTHCKEAVYEAEGEQSESDMIESLMSVKDDTVILESIKRTTQRTQMMISHIDKMMDVFHVMCEKRGDREKRRYHVIYDYYIARNKKSLQRIADEYSVSRVTIYNDLKSAEEELSVFFFGVDGLHIETTLPTA